MLIVTTPSETAAANSSTRCPALRPSLTKLPRSEPFARTSWVRPPATVTVTVATRMPSTRPTSVRNSRPPAAVAVTWLPAPRVDPGTIAPPDQAATSVCPSVMCVTVTGAVGGLVRRMSYESPLPGKVQVSFPHSTTLVSRPVSVTNTPGLSSSTTMTSSRRGATPR